MNNLLELSNVLRNGNLSKEEAYKEICKTAVKVIDGANLVSLWVFDTQKTMIRSLINYDGETEAFNQGIELYKKDYPKYFEAIVERQILVANDARKHPVTECFTESYFEPLNIYSLLDFILHKDYQPIGVICCEAKGAPVIWSDEDTENIRTLATLISFCFDIN